MTHRRARLRALFLAAAGLTAAAVFASVGGATTAATAPSSTADPVVSGKALQGETLTTTSGSWSGTTPITFTYAWQRCDTHGASCSVISGATTSTYTLTSDDVGHTMRSKVTAKNSEGSDSASSNPTDVVSNGVPANSALPTISGSAAVGSVLTASNGTWNGTAPISYSYRWQRCDGNGANCAVISGATASTYTLVSADSGHTIRVSVIAANSAGQSEAVSNATSVVGSGGPVSTAAPVVTGTTKSGQTLTVSNGTWSGSSITYTYGWERCDTSGDNCALIAGATKQTYTLVDGDVGHTIRGRVTATNSTGNATARSAQVGPVTSGTPTGVIKLPDGELAIPASNVPDSDRLTVAKITYKPSLTSHGHAPVQATFKIVDENGYVVAGALVYVVGLPYNWLAKVPEAPTGTNGRVTMTLQPTRNAPRSGALVMFVRARTPQGDLLAGSSSRRLIQMKLRP